MRPREGRRGLPETRSEGCAFPAHRGQQPRKRKGSSQSGVRGELGSLPFGNRIKNASAEERACRQPPPLVGFSPHLLLVGRHALIIQRFALRESI